MIIDSSYMNTSVYMLNVALKKINVTKAKIITSSILFCGWAERLKKSVKSILLASPLHYNPVEDIILKNIKDC